MTVRELIKHLQKCSQEADIYVENPDRTIDYFLDHIEQSDKGVFIQTAD